MTGNVQNEPTVFYVFSVSHGTGQYYARSMNPNVHILKEVLSNVFNVPAEQLMFLLRCGKAIESISDLGERGATIDDPLFVCVRSSPEHCDAPPAEIDRDVFVLHDIEHVLDCHYRPAHVPADSRLARYYTIIRDRLSVMCYSARLQLQGWRAVRKRYFDEMDELVDKYQRLCIEYSSSAELNAEYRSTLESVLKDLQLLRKCPHLEQVADPPTGRKPSFLGYLAQAGRLEEMIARYNRRIQRTHLVSPKMIKNLKTFTQIVLEDCYNLPPNLKDDLELESCIDDMVALALDAKRLADEQVQRGATLARLAHPPGANIVNLQNYQLPQGLVYPPSAIISSPQNYQITQGLRELTRNHNALMQQLRKFDNAKGSYKKCVNERIKSVAGARQQRDRLDEGIIWFTHNQIMLPTIVKNLKRLERYTKKLASKCQLYFK